MKFVALLCFLGVAAANLPYQFSNGYLEVLGGEPTVAFTCDNRPYGYYADVANECKVFHVCVPVSNDAGEVINTYHFSFFCGNQTVFSQISLTCDHPGDAFPCSEAEGYYELSNQDFGKIPEDVLEREN